MTRNYAYKPRRANPNNPFMKGNDFLAELKAKPTLNDKMCRIVEANPLLLVFGTNLDPRNPYERNEDGQA
jgi:hypothetical protein